MQYWYRLGLFSKFLCYRMFILTSMLERGLMCKVSTFSRYFVRRTYPLAKFKMIVWYKAYIIDTFYYSSSLGKSKRGRLDWFCKFWNVTFKDRRYFQFFPRIFFYKYVKLQIDDANFCLNFEIVSGNLRYWESSINLVNVLKNEIRDGQLSFRGKKVLEVCYSPCCFLKILLWFNMTSGKDEPLCIFVKIISIYTYCFVLMKYERFLHSF